MSISLEQGQKLPDNTSTAAYNANEVASVFMSFDRRDLKTVATSLQQQKTGFYGMSDPLNLSGTLERFEVNFAYGANTANYKVRLINPTTELEASIMQFFNKVYPQEGGVIDEWNESELRRKQLESATGDVDDYYLNKGKESIGTIPTVYIRWGYGKYTDSGLSQIHKCRLTDVKYTMNPNMDKVVELMLTDLLTFTKTSSTFNKRGHKASVKITDENSQFRKPSKVLEELLATYASVYPEVTIISNISQTSTNKNDIGAASFGEIFDSVVQGNAAAMAKVSNEEIKDRWARQKVLVENIAVGEVETFAKEMLANSRTRDQLLQEYPLPGELPDRRSMVVRTLENLTDEQRADLEEKLNAPIVTNEDLKRAQDGVITFSIYEQAYKQAFEALGIIVEVAPQDGQKAISPGVTSNNQLSSDTDLINEPKSKSVNIRNGLVGEKLADDVVINLDKICNDPATMPDFTINQNGVRMGPDLIRNSLSWWPMTVERTEPPQPEGIKVGNITNFQLSGSLSSCGTYNNLEGSPVNSEGFDLNDIVVVHCDASLGEYLIQYTGENIAGQATFSTPKDSIKLTGLDQPAWAEGRDFYLYNTDVLTNGTMRAALIDANTIPNGVSDLVGYGEGFPFTVASNLFVSGLEGDTIEFDPPSEIYQATDFYYPPDPEDAPYPRRIRPMTESEKTEAVNAGFAPLWLNPGAVNMMKNPEDMGFYRRSQGLTQFNPNAKYTYTVGDLSKQWPVESYVAAKATGGNLPLRNAEVLTPIQVNLQNPREDYVADFNFPNEQVQTGADGYGGYNSIIGVRDTLGLGIRYAGREGEQRRADGVFFRDTVYSTDTPTYTFPKGYGGYLPIYDPQTQSLLPVYESSLLGDNLSNPYTNWAANHPSNDLGLGITTFPVYNMPYIPLEPTLETWNYMMDLGWKFEKTIKEALDEGIITEADVAFERDGSEVKPPPAESKLIPPAKKELFATLGTDGSVPHITNSLQKILNGLNSFVPGSPSKLDLIPLNLSLLTEAQLDTLFDDSGPLSAFKDSEDDYRKRGHVIVFVSTKDIIKTYTQYLINPVHSFPELTSKTPGHEAALFIDYATDNSIVTDLVFEGEFRWLMGISQASFMTRYFGDIEAFFNTEKNIEKMVNRFLGAALADQVNRLYSENATEGEGESSLKLQTFADAFQKFQLNKKEIESYAVIDSDLLALLPGLVGLYTNAALADFVGPENVKDLRLLSSLVNSPQFLNLLFPEAKIDPLNNTMQSEYLTSDNKPKEKETTILRRRIDHSTAFMRLGGADKLAIQKKIMDNNFWFTTAMQQQAWNVELETLGIPEIDNPIVEFIERGIILRVFDARLSTKTPHWLSGKYSIIGIQHVIDAREGYKTKLQLFKEPTSRDALMLSKDLQMEEAQ